MNVPAETSIGFVRRFPFPFRAALAICSDLDETVDATTFYAIARFLNTEESTPLGQGVGLETGNTIYFDMPPGQFAYWNTDDAGRAMVRALIRSGHVDCLHSFGDLATTRGHAARALEDLSRNDCAIEVWIDHGTAVTNFGADIMLGSGDVPGSVAYHADLTIGYGVRYVWRGRVTSVIGQDVPRSLGGLWTAAAPLQSARTLAKEALKGIAGRSSSSRYRMHVPNRLLAPTELRSGHAVMEFLRSNPHPGGVSAGDTGDGLAEVLSDAMLGRLVERAGACILYTHLGKGRSPQRPFTEATRAGLLRLAAAAHRGDVLVTTTRRLLGYSRARDAARVSVTAAGAYSGELVRIECDVGASDLQGLTVRVADARRARIFLNGAPVEDVSRHEGEGGAWIGLPWRRLPFPGGAA